MYQMNAQKFLTNFQHCTNLKYYKICNVQFIKFISIIYLFILKFFIYNIYVYNIKTRQFMKEKKSRNVDLGNKTINEFNGN